MSAHTLKLVDEFLMQGGHAPGIDAETLEKEYPLVEAAPRMKTALDALVVNYAQSGRVTDHFVRDVAALLQEIEA